MNEIEALLRMLRFYTNECFEPLIKIEKEVIEESEIQKLQ
jgi:hypothetical protein